MLGKTDGKRRKGQQRMRRLDSITDSINGHEFEQTLGDSEVGSLEFCSLWSNKDLVTKQKQQTQKCGRVEREGFKS